MASGFATASGEDGCSYQDSTVPVEISLILPNLNEASTIENCVRECFASIESCGVSGEVIVVDNGSDDGSQVLASLAGARVIDVARRGYGNALIAGIQSARGKYVLIGDSDMSYDFSQLPHFLSELRSGQELVIGCRMPQGGGTIEPKAMPWLHRWLGNPLLSLLGRILFRNSVNDFHCGIRAFERKRILELDLQTSGMEFATEMIVKASLSGLRIGEVPVKFRRDGRNGPSHLRTWQDGWRHLRFMLLHAPRWLFLYPGLAIMFFSGLVFSILLFGPIKLGATRFDTNTLLMATVGILAGFQITLMGLFSETFSCRCGLLPRSKLTETLLRIRPFEKGIFIGGGVLVVGTFCLLAALLKWQKVGFGDLSYPDTLRLVIPAVTGISLGLQIIFGGFLLAVLGLDARSPDA